MPITELALLRLLPPALFSTSTISPSVLSKLASAKNLMESFTNYKFYYLRQIEDPTLVYVLGEWNSLAQHMEDFIPGEKNQEALKSLEGEIEVVWLEHFDMEHANWPVEALEQGAVLSIARHFVKSAQVQPFKSTFNHNKKYLEAYISQGSIGGGWRVDKDEDGKEEFVLFCPWKDIDEHMEFQNAEGFAEYAGIREFVEGVDVRHVRVMEVVGRESEGAS
ncbi:hypothetical protein K432DRAFT_442983 [Lepidopterella palustris CBS 459.81]|uniref:ABM domain-containing protein n=1 Tax=Lepidopterella palustris CBS 459.81 TaxID=1314670 RepID=A0A8E2EBC8_9PEZI|nr:hypothetical protein K432DRAFT_442983 [Lepidopterella palustris CBS 459.81]